MRSHQKAGVTPLVQAYVNAIASKKSAALLPGVSVCMCMDAHVPGHWDICGNSDLAVMAKLAIKSCQGRDPLEGCNVYHRALAQPLAVMGMLSI